MEPATLDDFMAWNDELLALAQAGVPIDVDLGRSGNDALGALERVNATVARRVSQGATLAAALEGNEQVVTPAYSALVQLGLRSGNLSTALAGSNRLAESLDDSWQALRRSVFYPLLVVSVAYAGCVGFCLYFVPTLEDLHRELRLPVGPGLKVLQSLRATLPYWVALPPGALLLWTAWRTYSRVQRDLSYSRGAALLAWIPGMSRALFQQRCANFSETLAALLEAGTPLDEALRLAAGAWGDKQLIAGAQALAASLRSGPMLSAESHVAQRFPPFLRFALWHAEATVGRARTLRMAADLYRRAARRGVARTGLVAPLVLCVGVGGGVTLLYGLALFVPVIEMLRILAQ
jgi:type II secretory pathway component PulF